MDKVRVVDDNTIIHLYVTGQEITVLLEAISDKHVEWRKEVKRRQAAGEPFEALERNLNHLTDVRDHIKHVGKRS